jgi:uncharacterized membrane protein
MFDRNQNHHLSSWVIPAIYAGAALVAGLTFPRFESQIFPDLVVSTSVSVAIAFYSSVASGMIALTAIVFSLTCLMVQFAATAYSPRLVLWITRDPVITHALGIFTATFLYALAALAGTGRSGLTQAPFVSAWVVIVLLLVSVGMFIALVHRVALLQVNHMLIFTGNHGRKVIEKIYPGLESEAATNETYDFRALPHTQTLIHHGRPLSVQEVNIAALVNLAQASGGIIEMIVAAGDTVVELTPILKVFGAREPLDERRLRDGIQFGEERTFEQDPKYAIRLLVDIAIKALSPAINDPTTAVQALDQVEDLLLRLGQRNLKNGEHLDRDGKLRLVVPSPTWDDLVRLAFDEICYYGSSSVQVMRRMNALLSDLAQAVPETRRATLDSWDRRLKATIARSFTNSEERLDASTQDRQGFGVPRQIPTLAADRSRSENLP